MFLLWHARLSFVINESACLGLSVQLLGVISIIIERCINMDFPFLDFVPTFAVTTFGVYDAVMAKSKERSAKRASKKKECFLIIRYQHS